MIISSRVEISNMGCRTAFIVFGILCELGSFGLLIVYILDRVGVWQNRRMKDLSPILGLVFFFFGIFCIICPNSIKRRSSKPTACNLLLLIPFLPCIWLCHLFTWNSIKNPPKNSCTDRCCILTRPGSRQNKYEVLRYKVRPDEGFSWYLHSYLTCLLQWGCCVLNFTKNMKLIDSIRRYNERPKVQWENLLKELQENPYLSILIEYLNRSLPKFYFRVLPSGSIRERFGYPFPSTSILASDYDLMFVPDSVYVYDEQTKTEGRFPASFTAIDDPNQNPDRKAGHLWLELENENETETWKKLSYERMTLEGSKLISQKKKYFFITFLNC